MNRSLALLALFVFLGSTTQTLAGFGGIIIALTLGAIVFPIESLLPVLVPISLLVTGYVVLRHGGRIDFPVLLRRILPLMGIGAAAGYAVFELVQGPLLKRGYGVVVAAIALNELRKLLLVRPPDGEEPPPITTAQAAPWLLSAGVLQGIYASGGPLLVHAVSRFGLDKASFRSTLCVVWLTLNAALTVAYASSGRIDGEALRRMAVLAPVMVLAIVAGEWGHARVDERRFRVFIYAVLLFSGAVLVRG